MHARELVELAGVASAYGPLLIESDRRIPCDCVTEYWASSRVRLDRWARTLAPVADLDGGSERRRQARWRVTQGAIEEIFAGEVLARVWAAVLSAYDRRRGEDEVAPAARSVLQGHIEAGHRALSVLTAGSGFDGAAVGLNKLRHRAEHWTNFLIGNLAVTCDVTEFAANPERASDFADDLRLGRPRSHGQVAWPLAMASLRRAFAGLLGVASPNADLNSRIAASVLGCFPSGLLDELGVVNSLRIDRVIDAADQAQGMIDELMAAVG
ncbi:MAG: hypothetical protein LLG00_09455 [Planctomycetaceae bacterium]|nr:hypothetical protein [Planctomycetaceae bacterium]